MVRSTAWATCTSAIVAVAACESPPDRPRSDAAAAGTPISIDPVARTSIGVVEGDTLHELHEVVTPFLLPGGQVAVPLGAAGTIRIFGSDGEFIRSLGRKGSGPGEFEYLIAAWPRGDTLEGLDFRLRRITRFRPDGSTEDIAIVSDHPDFSGPPGPLGDGWALWGVESGAPGMRDRMVFRRIARTGEDVGEIARFEGMARYEADRFRGPEPLSPRASAVVHDGHLYIGEGMTGRIRVLNGDGEVEREIAWAPPPQPDPGEVFRMVIDTAIGRASPERQPVLRRRLEAAPVPDRVPAFWQFLVDEQGFVWLRPYEPLRHSFALGGRLGPGGAYVVLSPEGEVAGTVAMPPDLEPARITRDAVIGIARDEFGVESVRVHALTRR